MSPGSTSTTTTSTTTTTATDVSSPSTTTTPLPCVLSQLPDDSLAGVECAIAAVRRTLTAPPQPTCTCRRCSVEPRLDRLAHFVTQAEAGTTAKKYRRKLARARRAAKALSAKAGAIAKRGCLAPAERATSLDAETDELARRTVALSRSAFCVGR